MNEETDHAAMTYAQNSVEELHSQLNAIAFVPPEIRAALRDMCYKQALRAAFNAGAVYGK